MLVRVIVSQLDVHQQTTLFVGAKSFISRSKMPRNVAEQLRLAAAIIRISDANWLMVIPVPRFQVKSLLNRNRAT
jgi:hypothetical protein